MAAKTDRPMDIAIVGMACRFPGARDLGAFWENVVAARDCTGDVPADRWDPAVFFDPGSGANDRVPCRRGGYLDQPIEFDPALPLHDAAPPTTAPPPAPIITPVTALPVLTPGPVIHPPAVAPSQGSALPR